MEEQNPLDSSFNKRINDLRDHYVTQFDPKEYCKTFYSVIDDEVKFFLKSYHEAFQKDPILTSRKITQRRVLDFGCGPVPIYAATAAASFTTTVTMAEMVPLNRDEISKWMNSDKNANDWSDFFTYINFLQERSEEETVDVVQQLRNAFQLIIPCDGAMSNPLSPVSQRYDVVMSTLCLEFATTSLEDYRVMMGNVINILRPGGVFLMAGALGNTSYSIGQCQYPSVKLEKEDILTAVTGNGMCVKSLHILERQTSEAEKPADHRAVFFLSAQKPTQ
ncbi:hypothetical protein SK128_001344 [Halocaridina rubra]|uniref:Nicotinamide N-methyltransferase-like n=1 Tax=Halocaridina rubra TaxID=373956 RepID=A0AAN8XUL1_HALRR